MGLGHWCGAAVPTMMETVVVAQCRRNIFPLPALELPAAFGVRGGGICNVMVGGGAA